MAKNLIFDECKRVVVTASADRTSGQAVREDGWNGVALVDAKSGSQYTLVTQGVVEVVLAAVTIGNLIYTTDADKTTLTKTSGAGYTLFGKAIGASAAGTNKVRVAVLNTL